MVLMDGIWWLIGDLVRSRRDVLALWNDVVAHKEMRCVMLGCKVLYIGCSIYICIIGHGGCGCLWRM